MKDLRFTEYGVFMHHSVNVIDVVYYRARGLRGSGGLLWTSHLFSFPDNLGFLTRQIVQNTFVHNVKSDIRHEHHRNIHKHKKAFCKYTIHILEYTIPTTTAPSPPPHRKGHRLTHSP